MIQIKCGSAGGNVRAVFYRVQKFVLRCRSNLSHWCVVFQTHLVLTVSFWASWGGLNKHCGHQALKFLGGALLWLMLESLSLGCNSLFWLVGDNAVAHELISDALNAVHDHI
jgi:hypothetical protein